MKMKLPPYVSFHHDLRLMVFRPLGILDEKRVDAVIEFLETEENKNGKPFNRFSDLSKLDAINLDFHYVFRVSLHRRLTYAQHPPVKSAFFVTSEAAARIVKIHMAMTDHSPLQVEMFEELAAVAKWLGVSNESLEY